MLVYKFYKLPYEYEPGVTRSIYREKFLGQYTSYQGSLPQRQKAGEASPQRNTETLASTSFFYPTIAPCGNFITHSVSNLPRQAFWFPDPVPCTSLQCFSKSRIFFPVLSPAHTISMMAPSGKENFTAANLFVINWLKDLSFLKDLMNKRHLTFMIITSLVKDLSQNRACLSLERLLSK